MYQNQSCFKSQATRLPINNRTLAAVGVIAAFKNESQSNYMMWYIFKTFGLILWHLRLSYSNNLIPAYAQSSVT